MQIRFEKYQGTGNDFIIIDNRQRTFPVSNELIQQLCDRKFGIGSDGLILFEEDDASDFYMNFFNPDASKSFCGNGSRCIVKYAIQKGIIGESCVFKAIDGLHEAKRNDNWIHIKMNNVNSYERKGLDYQVDTGSPHYIKMVENVDIININAEAHRIRYSEEYQEKGINVNFVEHQFDKIKMRTYERGVEGETLSCGTGVTATVLAMAIEHNLDRDLDVNTKGGQLRVTFERNEQEFKNIWLCGPAEKVYEGQIDVAR
ncbi:MAG: diaminopimelate epimerase [Bacteroidota bacterium]